jgi:hypothetical protein
MPTITRFAVRSNGRVLADVRRPGRDRNAVVDLKAMKKDELVELAESKGVESDGTKADLVERLGSVQ